MDSNVSNSHLHIKLQGSWEETFDKNATKDADFHVSKDKTIKVPTMHKTATYRYGESSELDAQVSLYFYIKSQSNLNLKLSRLSFPSLGKKTYF